MVTNLRFYARRTLGLVFYVEPWCGGETCDRRFIRRLESLGGRNDRRCTGDPGVRLLHVALGDCFIEHMWSVTEGLKDDEKAAHFVVDSAPSAFSCSK